MISAIVPQLGVGYPATEERSDIVCRLLLENKKPLTSCGPTPISLPIQDRNDAGHVREETDHGLLPGAILSAEWRRRMSHAISSASTCAGTSPPPVVPLPLLDDNAVP